VIAHRRAERDADLVLEVRVGEVPTSTARCGISLVGMELVAAPNPRRGLDTSPRCLDGKSLGILSLAGGSDRRAASAESSRVTE
jgi:hypothetical protein